MQGIGTVDYQAGTEERAVSVKLFNGKEPSPAEVEARRGKVESERAAIRAQQAALEAQIADAYGTETDTDALAAQYAALEAKLTALALVGRQLNEARISAVKRALLADYRAEVEAIAADWRALQATKPKREKAGQTYFNLLSEENAIRRRLKSALLGGRQDALRTGLAQAGLDPTALNAEVEALEDSISAARSSIVRYVNTDGSYGHGGI